MTALCTEGAGATPCAHHSLHHTLRRARAAWCTLALGLAAWLASAPAAAQAVDTPSATVSTTQRPRIGLVLSGGGARGLAHVGVLKVLERERVPVDVIAGTSMGAIIGGLYASGMGAEELEAELKRVNWSAVFSNRVDRQQLAQRRKEEDFDISPVLEFGLRDGELRLPLGAVSGRGLESLLRRYTLRVRRVNDFDRLPIPFRAVATDMESGEPVVLKSGDLAMALRSSMSVPGVFAPTELNGRILGDGGLVNNVPIDVARAMGADIVIVVNVGTPVSGREVLDSVAGVTGQMINILTEQNVQRSLATLTARDVLIKPGLDGLSSGDFERSAELIRRGEESAQAGTPRWQALGVDAPTYDAWRQRHASAPVPATTLRFLRFEGQTLTNPKRLAAQLESAVGQPFDPERAERDARRLAASDDYVRADYLLSSGDEGDGLVFALEDKPWGPNYIRVGLDMRTDFRGDSAFNIKLSHNRHWLDDKGSEWRNQLQIGETPRLFTELYHPLNWTLGLWNDWFVAGYAEAERRAFSVYNDTTGDARGRFRRISARWGLDLGQRWGEYGALRIGLAHLGYHTEPELLSADYTGPNVAFTTRETGLRARGVVDQLDFVNFPQRGYRTELEVMHGLRRDTLNIGGRERFTRVEAQGTAVRSMGPHTLNLSARFVHADQRSPNGLGRDTLGGFQHLSGYEPGQIEGNYLLFGRLSYYQRLRYVPPLTRGLFAGASIEAGNAWRDRGDMKLDDLRLGSSLFFGADTGLGPLHLAITHAPKGSTGLYLLIGRP
jgi:NTE family protein